MTQWLDFHVPEDKNLLAAMAEVTLRHEQLHHVLKMTVKSIANLTVEEALESARFIGAKPLRDRVKILAKKRLGESPPYLKLEAILSRARRLSDKRNCFVHGLYAKEMDGDPGILGAPGEIEPLPTVEELKQLASDLESLTNELNHERLEGFLKHALDESEEV